MRRAPARAPEHVRAWMHATLAGIGEQQNLADDTTPAYGEVRSPAAAGLETAPVVATALYTCVADRIRAAEKTLPDTRQEMPTTKGFMMRTLAIRLTAGLVLCGALCLPAFAKPADYDAAWKKAVTFLLENRNADGTWSRSPGKVGVTAVVLESLTLAPESLRKREDVRAAMKRAADALAGFQQKDGAIHDPRAPKNYSTSLATMALAKYDREAYAAVIDKAVAWIRDQQATEVKGYDPDKHATFGGFGYGSSLRPDLSNTWIALDALKAAGVPEDDPVWDKARVFIKRCQNSSEVNDQPYAGDDGGAMYLPGESPDGASKTRAGKTIHTSYGSISYAMLISYLWCDVEKGDLPVKLLTEWLAKNYSVEKNPNTEKEGKQGLYYYYRVMGKSLDAYGESDFAGHDWPTDLADALVRRQKEDGSWNNPADRWREGDPALVTGYALTALAHCRRNMK